MNDLTIVDNDDATQEVHIAMVNHVYTGPLATVYQLPEGHGFLWEEFFTRREQDKTLGVKLGEQTLRVFVVWAAESRDDLAASLSDLLVPETYAPRSPEADEALELQRRQVRNTLVFDDTSGAVANLLTELATDRVYGWLDFKVVQDDREDPADDEDDDAGEYVCTATIAVVAREGRDYMVVCNTQENHAGTRSRFPTVSMKFWMNLVAKLVPAEGASTGGPLVVQEWHYAAYTEDALAVQPELNYPRLVYNLLNELYLYVGSPQVQDSLYRALVVNHPSLTRSDVVFKPRAWLPAVSVFDVSEVLDEDLIPDEALFTALTADYLEAYEGDLEDADADEGVELEFDEDTFDEHVTGLLDSPYGRGLFVTYSGATYTHQTLAWMLFKHWGVYLPEAVFDKIVSQDAAVALANAMDHGVESTLNMERAANSLSINATVARVVIPYLAYRAATAPDGVFEEAGDVRYDADPVWQALVANVFHPTA